MINSAASIRRVSLPRELPQAKSAVQGVCCDHSRRRAVSPRCCRRARRRTFLRRYVYRDPSVATAARGRRPTASPRPRSYVIAVERFIYTHRIRRVLTSGPTGMDSPYNI